MLRSHVGVRMKRLGICLYKIGHSDDPILQHNMKTQLLSLKTVGDRAHISIRAFGDRDIGDSNDSFFHLKKNASGLVFLFVFQCFAPFFFGGRNAV